VGEMAPEGEPCGLIIYPEPCAPSFVGDVGDLACCDVAPPPFPPLPPLTPGLKRPAEAFSTLSIASMILLSLSPSDLLRQPSTTVCNPQ
jgi:hypothetical protein